MTANLLLKRLLGEATPDLAMQAKMPEQDDEREAPEHPEAATPEPEPEENPQASQNGPPPVANTQELVQQWQRGDHMAVAARLMFTEASYADFVDLVFAIGQQQGRMLGQLLDELADTEGMEPPQTPPEYKNVLDRVGSADSEEGVL